ncbi:MAG: O-antigen ligase family protein [Acidobacteria bacterium]|nr:O-antigen ligase family protein [Acidobacteriota bacterium]
MERFSRLVVLISLLSAGVAHAFFAGQFVPALPWAAAAALVVSFGLSKVSLRLGLTPALLLTYAAPAVLMVGFGTPDYHQLLVWMALFAGPIVAASDWSQWHVPGRWKAPVICWAMVIAVTWPIVALREVDFSLVAARTLDTPNAMLGGPPPATAAWVVSVALGQLLGILWLDLLWARFGAARLRRAERAIFVPLVISIAASAGVGIYQKNADIHWMNVGDWPSLARAGGLMLDGNSFGTAAAIWAPITIALVWRLGRPLWMSVPFAAVLVGGVWASGSRTAFLTMLVGCLAVGIAIAHRARAWQTRIAPLALLLAAGALVLFVAIRSTDPSNPLARLMDTLPRTETGGVAATARELWDRNGYGVAAGRAIREHPWAGVGIGAFNQLSSDFYYVATGGLIQPDNAQNWWRQQIVELGFVGAAPSLIISAVLVGALWRGRASGEQASAATVVRGVLTGLGVASLLGVATQHPALFLTFMTLVYWFGALLDPASPHMGQRTIAPALWAGLFVIPVCVAGSQLITARTDLRVPLRALRSGFPYGYGFSAPETDPQLGIVRWTNRHAVAVVRAEHAYLALAASTPQADAANPVRVMLRVDARQVADADARGPEPLTWIVRVRDGQRFLMIETTVSRLAADGKGMKLSAQWLREIPAGTLPDVVLP